MRRSTGRGHVDTIYNLIRACNPAPGAWTMLDGVKVRVYDCRKHVVGRFVPGGHKPGDIAGVTDELHRLLGPGRR